MKRNLIDASQLELEDKVVSIKRVTKVVKGGRNFRFTALVVVGDGNGHVGAGLGKAAEIPEAIRKGKEDAMKNLVTVARDENNSITHDFVGKYGSAEMLLKRASGRYWCHRWWSGPCSRRVSRNQKHPCKMYGFQKQTERCSGYHRRPETVKDSGRSCKTSRKVC